MAMDEYYYVSNEGCPWISGSINEEPMLLGESESPYLDNPEESWEVGTKDVGVLAAHFHFDDEAKNVRLDEPETEEQLSVALEHLKNDTLLFLSHQSKNDKIS